MFIYGEQKNSDRTGLSVVTEFCLVRHGSTDWNIEGRIQGCTDTPLNEQGRREAARTGRELKEKGWEGIVASDLSRAGETAKIIGAQLGLEVLYFPELRERDFGPLEGKRRVELEKKYPGWHPQKDLPGLESKADLRNRAERALTYLARIFAGHRIVVVSHGGLLKAFFHQALHTDERSVDNAEAIEVIYADGVWRFG